MFSQDGWRRRDVLRGGLLNAGMISLACVSGSPVHAWAAPEDDEVLKIVDLEGNITPVLDRLIEDGDYFRHFGLRVSISNVTDGSKIIASLISGSGDLCAGSGFSGVFPAIERGAKIKIVAGAMQRPQDGIYTRRSDVRSSHDLVGKVVGTGPLGALLHQLAVALMIKQGVDYTKVTFRNVGTVADVFKAVVAGTVDAGLGTIDVFDRQKEYGVHILSDGALWNELPEFTNQAMIASDRAIAQKRGLLVKALAAHAQLYRFIASRKSEQAWARARIDGLHKNDPVEAETQWKFFNSPGTLATGLVLEPRQFEYIQQLNVRLGMQRKVMPFDQVADMSIARDALSLLG